MSNFPLDAGWSVFIAENGEIFLQHSYGKESKTYIAPIGYCNLKSLNEMSKLINFLKSEGTSISKFN